MKSVSFDYDYNPKLQTAKLWDIYVTDPDGIAHTKPGWAKAKETGTLFLGYLSWTEIGPSDPYLNTGRKLINEAKKRGIAVMAKNPAWKSSIMDVANPDWQELYMELVDDAMEKGYDGHYADVTDGWTEIPNLPQSKEKQFIEATIFMMARIRNAYANCYQMVNRSWDLLPDMSENINHVLVETVFHGKEGPVKEAELDDTLWHIKEAQEYVPVTILDYVPSGNKQLALKIFKKATVLGCGCTVVQGSLTNTVVLSPIPPRS